MSISIREAYGAALAKYGEKNKDVVVLDADVSTSTKSLFFGNAFPERFFNVGVAEANMVAMACGLAAAGKIPFCNSFASFITTNGLLSMKALASYDCLNVKIAGAYGGLSDSYDGPTHHSIEDLAIVTALPNFTVVVASDEIVTEFLVNAAIETEGPFYLRLSRETLPIIYNDETSFEIGKAKEVVFGTDIAIISCGVMVSEAIKASKDLKEDGINASVVDMITVKPIDEQMIVETALRSGAIVIAEEHNQHGGIGVEICRVLAVHSVCVPTEFVAIKDTHAESGAYTSLLSKFQLDSKAITDACRRALARKMGITGEVHTRNIFVPKEK